VKMKAGSILFGLISIMISMVLLQPVLAKTISVGLFISLVTAVFSMVQMMSWGLTNSVDQLARHREYLKDLTEFAALDELPGAELPHTTPPPVFESIVFRNVRFKYPGMDSYILDGLTLDIHAGRHYAFVGVNGAGKTTITKLLTGLYDGYEGEILLNRRPLSSYPQSDLKSFFSVVYQDFARYSIPFGDNIALGDVNGMQRDDAYSAVLPVVEQLGLREAVDNLPNGLASPLGKIRDDGQDLSGGQWQRVAMARSVISPAPLRILDEPTAAMDPIGESRLYEEFENISRGGTTLFISHRLGSTKLADHIFVIGFGRVLEEGSHRELMEAGGEYAGMYESQRSWYL
jgi:ATP-binding cassette, subfamily B, bacterial